MKSPKWQVPQWIRWTTHHEFCWLLPRVLHSRFYPAKQNNLYNSRTITLKKLTFLNHCQSTLLEYFSFVTLEVHLEVPQFVIWVSPTLKVPEGASDIKRPREVGSFFSTIRSESLSFCGAESQGIKPIPSASCSKVIKMSKKALFHYW